MLVEGRMDNKDIGSFCGLHPGIESVGVCVSCGKGVCQVCKVMFRGRVHCKGCLESGKTSASSAPSMRDQFYPGAVCARLAAQGFRISNDRIGLHDVTVGYSKGLFVLNPTHTFVILALADHVDVAAAQDFISQCGAYARQNNPGIRGLSLLVVYAVLAGNRIERQAHEYAAEQYVRGLSNLVIPVLVDFSQPGVTFFRSIPFVMGAYYAYARDFIMKTFVF